MDMIQDHRDCQQQRLEGGVQAGEPQRFAEHAAADGQEVQGRVNAADEKADAFERGNRVQHAGELDGLDHGADHCHE